MASSTPSLLGLPYEIRERILQPLLQRKGLFETQQPLWRAKADFLDPLMQVSKQLRLESLEIFYRINTFRFVLDVNNHTRTDPTNCFAIEAATHGIVDAEPMPSAIPWKYPYLMEHVRHVQLHVHVPRIGERKDRDAFPERLRKLVRALDYGRKLKDLMLLIGTIDYVSALSEDERDSLAILAEIRLPGKLTIKVQPVAFKRSIDDLELASKILQSKPLRAGAWCTGFSTTSIYSREK